MDLKKTTDLLENAQKEKYVQFISEKGPNCCEECSKHHGQFYLNTDPGKPQLPIHPHCKCKYTDAGKITEKDKIICHDTRLQSLHGNLSEDDEKEIILALAKSENDRQKNVHYDPLDACGTQADELSSKLYSQHFKHWDFFVVRGSSQMIIAQKYLNACRLQSQHHVVLVKSKRNVQNSFILDTYYGDVTGKTSFSRWLSKYPHNFRIMHSNDEINEKNIDE